MDKNIKEVQEQLSKEYRENYNIILKEGKKAKLLEKNSFEEKFTISLALSILPWGIAQYLVTKNANFNFIPIEIVQPLSILIPGIIGTAGAKLISKKRQIEEKIRKFQMLRVK